MKALGWIILLAIVAGMAYVIVRSRRRWQERQLAAQARFAQFIAQAKPESAPLLAPSPVAIPTAREERLLLEAAGKASEAGEPALALQLYARLLARFPQSSLAAQARAAVAELQKRLAQA